MIPGFSWAGLLHRVNWNTFLKFRANKLLLYNYLIRIVLKISDPKKFIPAYPVIILQVFIGWHFLYEGLIKILVPGWSAEAFLRNAYGPLEAFFHFLSSSQEWIEIVNWLNIIGLTAIGLALLLGLFTRLAIICGIMLLMLYYAAGIPLINTESAAIAEGNYLFVNKTLIEAASLLLLYHINPSRYYGLDYLIKQKSKSQTL